MKTNNKSVFKVDEWPALLGLVENWEMIRDEVRQLDTDDRAGFDRQRLVHSEAIEKMREFGRAAWCNGWGRDREKWLNYLIAFEDEYPFGDAQCPKTVELLKQIKGICIAAFSVFKPMMYLEPHWHGELEEPHIYTFHLGLDGPADHAYLKIGDQFIPEKPGHAFVFDGARRHYAYNMSEETRVVLYVEFYVDKVALA